MRYSAGLFLGWRELRGWRRTIRYSACIECMVQVLSSRGRYKEALRWNKRVLSGREKVLGMDHSDTLESLHDIAYNLKQLGNKVEALEWYRRALEEKD
ncbi:hypothetical protein P167DRAFT_507302 [Morchella conica CCBAS932]|uniref:TPR-like protein n=1 Tax=Morchella conica CCBAS932 TaxID=1392247 RepID=A0A3N4KRF1_9PEZI|nr:hypothetical protein P167DRAFT_507302 [Morchella conica CCBAS932]